MDRDLGFSRRRSRLVRGDSEPTLPGASPPGERSQLLQAGARTSNVGTLLWMAPEVLGGRADYGPEVDVYSYGVVMWEIASQQTPWSHLSRHIFAHALLQYLNDGQRPGPVDSAWPGLYSTLLKRCWATAPADRPTFATIMATGWLAEAATAAAREPSSDHSSASSDSISVAPLPAIPGSAPHRSLSQSQRASMHLQAPEAAALLRNIRETGDSDPEALWHTT